MTKQLLAPNRKPSNLNAMQYELVRTPEFKKWFGDWEKLALTKFYDSGIDEVSLSKLESNVSKVIDENGEPLVCQHRTNEKFNIFDKNKAGTKTDSGYFGKGFYFSPKGLGSISYGLNIIYCFLNIKNPKYINSYDIQPNNTHDVIVLRGEYDFILHKKLLKEESKEIQEIVVFEPNQIKLADGTNTTFDSENDDIRFDNGGATESTTPDYLRMFLGK